MMISAIVPDVFRHVKAFGGESIEIEFKVGKVSRHRFDAIRHRVTKDARFEELTTSTERNEFNGTDARRVIVGDVHTHTLYKKKLMSLQLDAGRLDVSLERPGDPDTSRPYTIFRNKHRVSYVAHDIWRLDLTRVRTNDPRYADCDDELFEVELELLLGSDMMLYYTLEYAMQLGEELFRLITEV